MREPGSSCFLLGLQLSLLSSASASVLEKPDIGNPLQVLLEPTGDFSD